MLEDGATTKSGARRSTVHRSPCDSMFRRRKKFPRLSQRREGGNLMGKFFENLNGVLIAGLVLGRA
jgi:hypothetical protein